MPVPSDEGRYAIGDLAGLAGITPRTVRYYIAQGLLPGPAGSGPGAHYTESHLARLRLIRRLQRQHQPLSEIRQRLAMLGDPDVAELLAEDEPPEQAPADSALEYVRSILGTGPPSGVPPALAVAAPAAAPAPRQPAAGQAPTRLLRAFAMPRLRDVPAAPPPALQTEGVASAVAEAAGGYDAVAAAAPVAPETEQRSQWDRIGLTPNIEIHVRRPLSRLENRRVERLITIARQVLREEQS
jgi:DNA-binding transcriptional MerR regulator